MTLCALDGRALGTVEVTGATSIAELKLRARAALAAAAATDEMVDGMSEVEAKRKLKEMLQDAGSRKCSRSGGAAWGDRSEPDVLEQLLSDADEAAMEAAAATLRGAGAVALPALQLVDRLLQNVLGNPDEAKYRRIRLANAKIDGALRPQPAARRLLELCGFAASDDGEHLDMTDAAARDCARLELARAIIKRAREAVEID